MSNGQTENPAGTGSGAPCFFFSYARKDRDRYLEKFFEDLSERVSQKGALDRETGDVSFRDLPNIEPGDDWEEKLAEALQVSRVLVSIYTPWYFKRPYCGKEFNVFLKRQRTVTYENGRVKNSKKNYSDLVDE